MSAGIMTKERKLPEGFERTYTVDEVATVLGFHPNTIRLMLKSGEIIGFKVGNKWRVNKHTLDGLIHAQDGDGDKERQSKA